MPDSQKSQAKHSGNAADLLSQFREQRARHEENRMEGQSTTVQGATHKLKPSPFSTSHWRFRPETLAYLCAAYQVYSVSGRNITRDEVLSGINEAWPHIGEYIQQMDESRATFERELYEETANNRQLHDENEDLCAQIIKLETRIESLQPTPLSERIIAPTPTTESPTGSQALTTPVKVSYSRKRARKLDENEDFLNKDPMSVPNVLREDNDGYFLEQDVDITAWLTKVIAVPILRRLVTDSTRICFALRCIGADGSRMPPSLCTSVPKSPRESRVKHRLNLEQIYHQIIPYMIRDDEKRPLSSAAVEHAAYMALHEQEKAPYKGKKPATAARQSKPSVHALTPAKTGESSQQQLDADLESYGQAREQVLPYEEAPPSSEPDAGEIAPPAGGANSTLYDESTMDIDQIVGDIYRDC
ncbi:hypothetical protein M422DRAFT_250475 [Sphaerobolus stellatus SS14]|uniref:Uncharacterized protein n=1 Tax=Sphaerobolus stellatus (strain SS14) TaxID=990650 RepID=A0A0C9W2Y3_SPHS4|nr:hypothetical protein M422DRAFT_250475 [Sphaerobolus stellatus SS14]